jgi:hypothetical protein
MLGRRGFLSGVFSGVTAAGLLIRADPAEAESFIASSDATKLIVSPERTVRPTIGTELYNKQGELVAFVDSIECRAAPIDVTTAFDLETRYARGLPEARLTAIVVGAVEYDMDSQSVQLVGKRRR